MASAKKLPGYETVFITRGEMADSALKTFKDKLESIIKSFQGEVITMDDWGKRKLAYEIQKESRGNYTYCVYTGSEGVVREIERNLRLNESMLRFLTVQIEKEFDADAFQKKMSDRAKAAERPAAPEIQI